MTFIGRVSKGSILLPPDVQLPDGLELQVTIPELPPQSSKAGERLSRFAGIVKDLPPDFAKNHDHYIHGAAKR